MPGLSVLYRRIERHLFGQNDTFDNYAFDFNEGPNETGLDTIRLINRPADFTETCLDALEIPDY